VNAEKGASWALTAGAVGFEDLRAEGPARVVDVVGSGNIAKLLAEDLEEAHVLLVDAGLAPLPQYEAVRQGCDDPTSFTSDSTTNAPVDASSFSKAISTAYHRDCYQHCGPYRGQPIGGWLNMPTIDLLLYSTASESRLLEWVDIGDMMRGFLLDHPLREFAILCEPRFGVDTKYALADPDLPNPGPIPFVYPDGDLWTAHIGGGVRGLDPIAQHVLEQFMSYGVAFLREPISNGVIYVSPAQRTAHRGLRLHVDGRTTLTRRLYRPQETRSAA
jgi:hypothetical protein